MLHLLHTLLHTAYPFFIFPSTFIYRLQKMINSELGGMVCSPYKINCGLPPNLYCIFHQHEFLSLIN